MGLSGYEAFIMVTVSPVLLGIASLRSFIVRNVRFVHLLSLSGLLAYLIGSPELRLTAVGLGVFLSCIGWSATFYAERNHPTRLQSRALAWSAGLIASSIAKFAFHTNNPIWPVMHTANGGCNKLGISLAILTILKSTTTTDIDSRAYEQRKRPTGSSIFAGCGLAGLFFAMHSLLSDSSTMILWTWEGFPVRGPIAIHGVFIITAMSAGLCSSIIFRGKISAAIKMLSIAGGAYLVTAFSHWLGYIGAMAIAFSTMSVAPGLIAAAVQYNPAITFGLGFFLYNVMVLAHVWVVAYAFVPGGPLMREHTDWVMAVMVLLIGVGVYNVPAKGSPAKSRARLDKHSEATWRYVFILGALQVLALSLAYLRFPTNDNKPYQEGEKVMTAGVWTIHFSLDNDMWSSEHRMRDIIRELELDVVGLIESDSQRIIMGNRDTTQFLAEDLGMYVDYGPGPDKHTWGCALLSKFPIMNSTHHLLPSPVGELAPAIHATLKAYGHLVDVFVFHSGQEEDPEDRRLQSEYLAQLMHDSLRPSILLSYLVTMPHEGNYNTYVGEKSGMNDIDPSDWDRWCEYILYKGLKRSGYARVSRSTITDTEIQVSLPQFAGFDSEASS